MKTIESFNRTFETTEKWLKHYQALCGYQTLRQAYTALRAFLHSVRDRLTVEEASHLAAELPMLVRGFYYEGWRPALAPNKETSWDEFLDSVEESLHTAKDKLDTNEIVLNGFKFLKDMIEPGQLRHVYAQMPQDIKKHLEMV